MPPPKSQEGTAIIAVYNKLPGQITRGSVKDM